MRHFFIILAGLFGTLCGSSLLAQNVWETLPVFHGGRVMPLHTFARQTVREICGTERPYIIRDDAAIAEFNQMIDALRQQDAAGQEDTSTGYPYLIPDGGLSSGGFNKPYSLFEIAGETQSVRTKLPVQGFDMARIEDTSRRVRHIVPMEGRYFCADEILLSWICEPEIWTYIPIFLVSETDYLEEIFDISFKGDARTSQYRLSLYQLEKSQRYKQRCADIQKRYALGQITGHPVPFDQITERLEKQSRLFRELTFHPQRQQPSRMLSILYQAAGLTNERSSYASAFNAWGYLLTLGETPDRQAMERSLSPDKWTLFHPTTERWHGIADKLRFIMQIYDQKDSSGNPLFPKATLVEQQYEILLDIVDMNLTESAALMEAVYPGISYRLEENDHAVNVEQLLPKLFSPENQQQNQKEIRQTVIHYHYAVKKLRNDVEAAYLALYDNGYSLRFLPLRSSFVLESGSSQDDFGVQPWASAQMILGSGETFIKRFLDPQLNRLPEKPPILEETSIFGEEEEESAKSDTDSALTDGESGKTGVIEETPSDETPTELPKQSLMDLLLQPFEMEGGILPIPQDDQSSIGAVRSSLKSMSRLQSMQASFESSAKEYGNVNFRYRAQEFADAVRLAAKEIETHRKPLADEDNKKRRELLTKTAYPENMSKLRAEYWYDRLHPFYWMGIFALLAALLNSTACLAALRKKSVVTNIVSIYSSAQGRQEKTELPDYTNSAEEWLFLASVVMLTCSIVIAFLGGVVRAGITGWAPVTNMYETVVMMAFATAVLGTWYTLYPLLHPAVQLAWTFSEFPGISVFDLFHNLKNRNRETTPAPLQEGNSFYSPPVEGCLTRRGGFILAAQCLLAVPRLILTVAMFYAVVWFANGDYLAEHGLFSASMNMLETTDAADLITVTACVVLIVWFCPPILLTLFLTPLVLFRPAWIAAEKGIHSFEMNITAVPQTNKQQAVRPMRSTMSGIFQGEEQSGLFHGENKDNFFKQRDISGEAWLKQARNAVLDRKLFIVVTAGIVFVVGLIASLSRAEDIKPIAPVLRSNFWLGVHVKAIIVSYAAAFLAWGLAVVSLGYAIFGRYQRTEVEFEGQKVQVQLPKACQLYSPVIERLIRIALLLLIIGTVLGARWADYSWGRFWGWDPKEVWALITIIFYVIVLHGKVARYYGAMGITVGALFASIAVIVTWYGINFAFKGSVHAYGGGAAGNAAFFLAVFIMANVCWGSLAVLRYSAEVYGNEAETGE